MPPLPARVLEEELLPGRPPVAAARDELARSDDLDARLPAECVERMRVVEDDADLAWPAGIVRRNSRRVGEGCLGARLDQLTGTERRDVPRTGRADPFLDRDRLQ